VGVSTSKMLDPGCRGSTLQAVIQVGLSDGCARLSRNSRTWSYREGFLETSLRMVVESDGVGIVVMLRDSILGDVHMRGTTSRLALGSGGRRAVDAAGWQLLLAVGFGPLLPSPGATQRATGRAAPSGCLHDGM